MRTFAGLLPFLAFLAFLAPAGAPAVLPVAAGGARQPSVAVDPKGGVHVVFGSSGRVLVASLPPGAAKFGEPRTVAEAKDMSLGMRRGPRLVAAGDALVAAWIEARFDPKQRKMHGSEDLVAARSVDGGATWSRPARVNRRAGACGEGLHALAAGPGGTVYAAWLQPIREGKKGMGIRVARSDDAGATWTSETSPYDPPSGTVCECCHPTLAVAPDGKALVMFRNSLEGARDMYAAVSSDRGKTFAKAEKLGKGSWPLVACPMDGGGAAFGEGGVPLTAWRREGKVYLTSGAGPEAALGDGEQPWAGGAPGGPAIAAWTTREGRVLAVEAPAGKPPQPSLDLAPLGGRAAYVSLAGSASGAVFAAWEVLPADGSAPRIEGAFLRRGR